MMASVVSAPATLADLAKVPERAELVSGGIVYLMPSGRNHGRYAQRILASLNAHVQATGAGEAVEGSVGYAIRPPLTSGRESFQPDASFYTGPSPYDSEDLVEGPPTFAVEVRSKNDHGPAKDQDYADKRADYFEAGTLVVWDVNPKTDTITSYKVTSPDGPVVFRRGEVADAEPAVPGWRLAVDAVFG